MGDIQDITTKERELEELEYILLVSSKMCADMEESECEFVAQKIREAGYTKHTFDVEALKRFLKDIIKFWERRRNVAAALVLGESIKDKIKELEGGE